MKIFPELFRIRPAAAACSLLAVLGVMSVPAGAHHSGAMFDTTKTVTINGAIKEVKWKNPHVYIDILSVDDAQNQTIWSIECSPINILARRGWKSDSLKPGDKVKLEGHPVRNGGSAAFLLSVTLPSGKVLQDHNY